VSRRPGRNKLADLTFHFVPNNGVLAEYSDIVRGFGSLHPADITAKKPQASVPQAQKALTVLIFPPQSFSCPPCNFKIRFMALEARTSQRDSTRGP
jgi:hypothetical protein